MFTRGFFIICILFANFLLLQHCGAQLFVQQGNQIIYHNNVFTFSEMRDTTIVVDPVTGTEVETVTQRKVPKTVNGDKIYSNSPATAMQDNSVEKLRHYIIDQLLQDFNKKKLPDGTIKIDMRSVVVNKQGKIIFYTLGNTQFFGANGSVRSLSEDEMKTDNFLMTAPAIIPTEINGEKVMSVISLNLAQIAFSVHNKLVSVLN